MLQLDYAYTRYAHRRGRTPYLSGFAFVVLLHAIMITALINALGPSKERMAWKPIETEFLPPVEEDIPLPPPTPPVIERPPPLTLPNVPTVTIVPPQGSRDTITEPVAPPPVPVESSAVIVSETAPQPIERTQTGPTYPAISRRLAEQGSVRLRLTIGIDGSVISASVINSSGYQRLDDAAVRWVQRNWRYEPALRGDMPIEATTEATLTFRLE